jgi:hypothetical protein
MPAPKRDSDAVFDRNLQRIQVGARVGDGDEEGTVKGIMEGDVVEGAGPFDVLTSTPRIQVQFDDVAEGDLETYVTDHRTDYETESWFQCDDLAVLSGEAV